LFSAQLDDGHLNFAVSLNNDGSGSLKVNPDNITLTYTKIKLAAGSTALLTVDNQSQLDNFGYDFGNNEWLIPDSIKQYASLSGDALLNQVHAVLNTLQTALRSLVESNTKLDFLDGSIEKVVDIVEKVEKVVYGDGTNDCPYGLLECIDGKYKKRFGDIEDFVNVFNDSWKEVFEVD
jgi:hypothetical protein